MASKNILSIFKRNKKDKAKSNEVDPTLHSTETRDAQPYRKLGLIQLYDGTASVNSDPNRADIVAVHGINGDPLESFTHSSASSACCWLRDLLPNDIPECRVFSYGYDDAGFVLPGASLSTPSNTIRMLSSQLLNLLLLEREQDETARPLIFIGHGLGGLIIKSLLVEARMKAQMNQTIFESTAGVLFMGTPHRATSAASLGIILAKMVSILGTNPRINSAVMRQLEWDSEWIQRSNEEFVHIAQNFEIYSFYEERPTRVMGFIVDRSSAVLGLPNEISISLNSDFVGLNKYQGFDDDQYRIVRSSLKRIYQSLRERRDVRSQAATNVILRPSSSLTGWVPNIVCKRGVTARGLIEVAGSMDDPNDFQNAQLDIIAVHGLGGSSYRSWINTTSHTLWLRDFLQKDFPNARIMSYGYGIDMAVHNRNLDLHLLASDMLDNIIYAQEGMGEDIRPLLLIGYSFGGLLIKKVGLRFARFKVILTALGTPSC
jgi:predicted alpha/beta-fold hydrolase